MQQFSALRRIGTGQLVVLFCGLMLFVSIATGSDSQKVEVFNYADVPVYAWPIPGTEAEPETAMTVGLPPRSYIAMESGGFGNNAEAPVSWALPEALPWMPPEWSVENAVGRISNGTLELVFHHGRLTLGPPERAGFQKGRAMRPMVGPLYFSGQVEGRSGLLSTERFSAVAGKAFTENGKAVLVLEKELAEAGSGLRVTETLRLDPVWPVLDYELVFFNPGTEPVEMKLTHASGSVQVFYSGEFAQGRKVLYCDRQSPRIGVLDDSVAWLSVQSRFIRPSAWAAVEDDGGYTLGVSTPKNYAELFGAETKWIFLEQRMVLDMPHEVSSGNGRPMVISPGGEARTAVRLYLLPPGGERFEEVGRAFQAKLTGRSIEFLSPFAVYRGADVMTCASIASLDSMHRYPDLWKLAGLTVKADPMGARFRVLDKGRALAALAVRFPETVEPVAEIEFVEVSKDARIIFIIRSADGNETVAAEWDAPGKRKMPLAREWVGNAGIELLLEIKGPPGAEAVLSGFRAGVPPPSAPELSFPIADGRHIAAGVSFRWQSIPGVLQYDLEFSKNADFSNAQTREIFYTAKEALHGRPDRGAAGDAGYFPVERLEPGHWYWRVRARSRSGAGAWSEIRAFEVVPATVASRKRFVPGFENFLLISSFNIGRDGSGLDQIQKAVPAELQAHTVNRLVLEAVKSARGESWDGFFNSLAETSGQFMIQSGHSGVDLALFETALQRCPNLIGFCQGELFWGFWEFPKRREMIGRMLELAANYGAVFVWGDGQEGAYNWLKLQEHPQWKALLEAYGEFLVPAWKMNLLTGQFTAQGAILGMQRQGLVNQTGVWPESFYWSEVGFGPKPGDFFGRQKGRTADMPPAFWVQNYLLGAVQGASVYVNHSPALFWDSAGSPTSAWNEYFAPFFDFMRRHEVIPPVSVVNRMAVPVTVPSTEGLRYSEDYGPFAALYRTLYGVQPGRELIELIPDSAAYRPVALIKQVEASAVALKEMDCADKIRERLAIEAGNAAADRAFVYQDGRRLVMMNPFENTPKDAGFELELETGGHTVSLSGQLAVHAYVIGVCKGDSFYMHINGRRDAGPSGIRFNGNTEIELYCNGVLLHEAAPDGTVSLKLDPARFPIELEVRLKAGGGTL